MRYIIFNGSTMYYGTDYECGRIYDDTVTDAEIESDSEDFARKNAEGFAYLHDEPDPEDFDTEEEYEEACDEEEQYYFNDANSNASWIEVSYEEYCERAEDNSWSDFDHGED